MKIETASVETVADSKLHYLTIIKGANMIYYHVNQAYLETESVLLPENFGRVLRSRNAEHNPMLFREYIFEDVRKSCFPQKPSRLESIFLCQDVVSMWNFIHIAKRINELIYHVEIIKPEKEQHIAPIELVNVGEKAWTTTAQNAHAYWEWDASQTTKHTMEVICETPVRIISRGLSYDEFKKNHNIP